MKRPVCEPSADRASAGDRVGEYVLDEVVGRGASGAVWRARHAVLPDVVAAVKIPRDDAFVARLRRESLIQHGLDHPGIVKVLGVDLDGEVPYLAEEFVEGKTLRQILSEDGRLSTSRALAIFYGLVDILRYAHTHGVVHRDLKPGNILIDDQDGIHVCDFGLGVQTLADLDDDPDARALGPITRGQLVGTWEYMAPEQRELVDDDAARDPRVDVYSLGVVLYEMLMGERPAGRVSLEPLSVGLDEVFSRCYTARQLRFRDAGELAAELHRLEGKAPRSPRDAASSPSKWRWFVAGYVVPLSILALVAGAVWVGRHGPFAPASPARDSAVAFPEGSRDEAAELAAIRRRIETEPVTVEEAAAELRAFRARSADPTLVSLASNWEDLLPADDQPVQYRVVWKRFRIDRDAYVKAFSSWLEPGKPDVFVRVYRVHDAKEELVFDTSETPIEAWSYDFRDHGDAPAFELNWARGDRLRIEMWDDDRFGDNRIAVYELDGELAILVLSTARKSAEGHAVEFGSSFGFGK